MNFKMWVIKAAAANVKASDALTKSGGLFEDAPEAAREPYQKYVAKQIIPARTLGGVVDY